MPLTVRVTDMYGQPIRGTYVQFAVASTQGAGATFSAQATALTNANGLAAAPALIANTAAGVYRVEVGVAGLGISARFTLTNTAGVPASITTSRGALQSAALGRAYGTALQALVTDAFGNPVTGAAVTFTVASSSGGAGALFAGKTSVTTRTGINGLVTAPTLTANNTPGSFSVSATVTGSSTPAGFSLTNTAAPAKMQIAAGNAQSTGVNQAFPADLAVVVEDAKSNPIAGVVVTFAVVAATGGAAPSFGGQAAVAVATNSAGRATAPALTANATAGSFTVVASIAGLSTQLTFDLTNT